MPFLLHKPVGQTPLQAIDEYRSTHPEYSSTTLGFAGRLDPMAEGLLIILVGDENKERKQYESLPKTYEFEVLVGISTDTYDVMGMIEDIDMRLGDGETDEIRDSETKGRKIQDVKIEDIEKFCLEHTGTFEQPYPPYSSKPVNGKPLYWWAREGKLKQIIIPKKQVTIHSFSFIEKKIIEGKDIVPTVIEKINKAQGDFRQSIIIEKWKAIEKEIQMIQFPVFHFQVACSSGTYVRGLVHEIEQYVSTPSLTWSIARTAIGDDTLFPKKQDEQQ